MFAVFVYLPALGAGRDARKVSDDADLVIGRDKFPRVGTGKLTGKEQGASREGAGIAFELLGVDRRAFDLNGHNRSAACARLDLNASLKELNALAHTQKAPMSLATSCA